MWLYSMFTMTNEGVAQFGRARDFWNFSLT